MDLTLLSLWVHVLIVTAWIGFVMLDVVAAATPGLTLTQRARMITWSRPFVVAAIALILLTGVRQTIDNPFLRVDSWSTLEQLRDRAYGLALFWKHGFVLATFGLTVFVRFVVAPRLLAAGAPAGAGASAAGVGRLERPLLWLSVANLGFCFGALILTTRMVWALH